jgi:PAT family beta-lactamase induction signal transducer AmpG
LALAPEAVRTDFWVVQGVVVTENVGAGLGTAVFMVYIMRCCDPRHKAAHMAIVTALMSLGFTVAGVASGFLASAVGFATYFGISFVAAIPAMVLLPFVPHLDGRES